MNQQMKRPRELSFPQLSYIFVIWVLSIESYKLFSEKSCSILLTRSSKHKTKNEFREPGRELEWCYLSLFLQKYIFSQIIFV